MKTTTYLRGSIAALTLGFASSALAQTAPIEYEVSFPNAAHHEAEISVTYRDLPTGPLTLRMSRSSPGRYALHEFAKNVYGLTATDSDGNPLETSRSDPYSWTVSGHSGTAVVTYTLYADRADGTYSQIDLNNAHLNMPATFLWALGLEDREIAIAFDPPVENWRAATQLVPAGDPMSFTAPDLEYFLDSPVHISDHQIREWQLADGQTIRFALHHQGSEEDFDKLVAMTKKVVDEQIKVFGEAPAFDHGTYTFIANYLPYASRDGMEHRNSTILTRPDSLLKGDFDHLGTVSHEFFHAWNVERLRPADLEPFNFFRANPSKSLWFAEGFTSYYGPLTIHRAGETTTDEYLTRLGTTLSRVINAPGHSLRSPRDMSLQAPFVDAATAVDRTNFDNIFVSYYPYGAMIALALDLSLRANHNTNLDDYMRLIWQVFGKTEIPFTNENLKLALTDISGDSDFAEGFFENYIENGNMPDFASLLANAGIELKLANPGNPWIGLVGTETFGTEVKLMRPTLKGTPLYEAGLDRDDEIIRIGRVNIDTKEDIDIALRNTTPGDTLEITYVQRGVTRSSDITLAQDPTLKLVRIETGGARLSRSQRRFRAAWLGETDEE
ncbi:MAG: M61 family peptidase [Pseudomonadota bacterium]